MLCIGKHKPELPDVTGSLTFAYLHMLLSEIGPATPRLPGRCASVSEVLCAQVIL